jgi:hypothetical protein
MGTHNNEGIVTGLTGGANQIVSRATGKDPGSTDPFGLFGHKGDPAADAARAAEAERKAGIAASIGKINKVFDTPERQNQYADFVSAVRSKYGQDLNDQQTIAGRNTRFATARSGLSGGSRDVDATRDLGTQYQRGVLTAEDKAQGALADLKNQDNSQRLQLIQLAQNGLDATTAGERAAATLRGGTQGALANATANGLGDIFANSAATYKQQQDQAALRAGRTAPLGSLYGKPGF